MTGFVYAIGDSERVKIGWSSDPMRRLDKIRSDCPAVADLLGLVPATREQEAEAHQLLARWRIHREWYRHEGAVAAFVAMLPRPRPRPEPLMEAGHPLKAFRHKQAPRLTQKGLADLLDVSQASISQWESGLQKVEIDRLSAIAEKTGIAPTKLRPDLFALVRSEPSK